MIEIAPGWHLAMRGPDFTSLRVDFPCWEAVLIGPLGERHGIMTDSEEALVAEIGEKLAELGVRIALTRVKEDSLLLQLMLNPWGEG